ncbi:MAG: histidine kinase dimerization/phosphoacceptor domain -containing protein [Flavobacteriales bacterium]
MHHTINNENIFELFFHESRDLVCIAGFDGYFKIINPAFVNLLGYSREELLGRPFVEFTHPDDVERTAQESSMMLSKGISTVQFENRYISKSGKVIHLQWNSSLDVENQNIFAIARDITEKKLIEVKLERTEKLMNTAQSMVKMGSWSFNTKDQEIFWTAELYNLFEIDPNSENLMQDFLSRLSPLDQEIVVNSVTQTIENGQPFTIESKVNLPGGVIKYVKGIGYPIVNEKGRVSRIEGVAQDITENKNAEDTIFRNIKEKEILLKELHHRVKNNLQVISSMLNLQSNLIANNQVKSILQDSQHRIKSMAAIHELLYKSTELSVINFSDYIATLSNDIVMSYRAPDQHISVKIDIEQSLIFPLDLAVPLGLFVNEVLTNSLKHGLKEKKNPEISLSISKRESTGHFLRISDNGIGFDKDKQPKDTLGLLLIESMTAQLDGSMVLQTGPTGTAYTLEF